MQNLNQWVASSDKFAVVVLVLFIIFLGVSATLLHLSHKINKKNN